MLAENAIHLGDCIDLIRLIPDKSIDLVLTDPPYGIGVAKTGVVGGKKLAQVKNYGVKNWDNSIPTKEYFDEIFRVSKNQIIFGGNYFTEYLKGSSCWIVWDKNNSGNFADCELAYTSFKTAAKLYKYTWNGMLQENMKDKELREHPTQKPAGLFKRILNDYSQPNDLILDPFSGSGTTAIAAHNLGRRFICIEKDKDYHAASVQRLKDTQAQLRLF